MCSGDLGVKNYVRMDARGDHTESIATAACAFCSAYPADHAYPGTFIVAHFAT